jgi:hypothetical protein
VRTLKLTILLFTATLIVGVGDDVFRSAVAWALGVPNTLFHYAIAYEVAGLDSARAVAIIGAPLMYGMLTGLLSLASRERWYSRCCSGRSVFDCSPRPVRW